MLPEKEIPCTKGHLIDKISVCLRPLGEEESQKWVGGGGWGEDGDCVCD